MLDKPNLKELAKKLGVSQRLLALAVVEAVELADEIRADETCTRCGEDFGATGRYDGGGGRELCKPCGEREGAPRLKSRR